MKPAVCVRCGRTFGVVPDDATDVVCFRCDEEDADATSVRRTRLLVVGVSIVLAVVAVGVFAVAR